MMAITRITSSLLLEYIEIVFLTSVALSPVAFGSFILRISVENTVMAFVAVLEVKETFVFYGFMPVL